MELVALYVEIRTRTPQTLNGDVGASSTALPGHNQGAGWKVGQVGHEPATTQDHSTCKTKTSAIRPPCQDHKFLLIQFSDPSYFVTVIENGMKTMGYRISE